ncbi:MAG: Fatty acid desaturase [Polyangiaceae bacterium]|jgi:stearoyl-CoA desaturase (delta-9 desaturase)|nr:Fatty acid desaturase [Polyangiaceae bacterium]
MLPVLVFFVAHWQISVFFQTFFLHRYGAHKQFTMSKGWERFFFLCTYVAQGSSFLSPRGYAILHRMHHAFSDTEKDPHSPLFYKNVFTMMLATKKRYDAFAYYRETAEPRFEADVPSWPLLEKIGQNWAARVAWGGVYTAFYLHFATSPWLFALLPAHFIMGPIHGAIVNWCGHKYGYRNYQSKDVSRNTLFFDFLTAGELFQNNHHEFSMSPNFAARRFEIDPTYPAIVLLDKLGIIHIATPQRMRYPRRPESETELETPVAAE